MRRLYFFTGVNKQAVPGAAPGVAVNANSLNDNKTCGFFSNLTFISAYDIIKTAQKFVRKGVKRCDTDRLFIKRSEKGTGRFGFAYVGFFIV